MKLTAEKQTDNGLFRTTERTWEYSTNHQVLVKTEQNITSRGSWAGNNDHYAKVSYICSCGKTYHSSGNAKKSVLAKHDTWYTQEQINQILKALEL